MSVIPKIELLRNRVFQQFRFAKNDEISTSVVVDIDLSIPVEPPSRSINFPEDVNEFDPDSNVDDGYDSDGNRPPEASHWDTQHSEENVPSTEFSIEELVPTSTPTPFI